MAYITITELPEKNDFPINNPWFIISTEDTSYKVQFQAIFNTVTNATNNYTDTNIASILDGAPADLDTLNKLAAALNDNPTFAADVLAQIAALTTDDVAEGANLYYTEDRVNTNFAAKSTTDLVEGSNLYYTEGRVNANFNSKSTTDLAEGLNLYFTNERVDDRVANLLQPGTNISLSYNDTAGTLTINSSNVGGYDLSANTTSDLSEGTNLYFTELRATSNFTSNLALTNTSALSEGSNLYYTDARVDANFATKDTSDLTEGTNLYYTDARVDANFALKSTTDLTEGTNLYYTDARARLSISVTDQGGDGSLTYNDADGIIEYVGPTAAEVRAHFSAGNGLTYDSATGVYSVLATSDVTFNTLNTTSNTQVGGDLTVVGNLDVQGTLTTLNTQDLEVSDHQIILNAGAGDTSGSAQGAGFVIQDGVDASNNSYFAWDQANLQWLASHKIVTDIDGNVTGNVTGDVTGDIHAANATMVLDAGTDGTDAVFTGSVTGNVTGQVSDISNHSTTDLSEGTNLYYTQARFDTAFTAKSTTDLSEGTNLYYTQARFDSALTAKSTTDLSEGTNLYYTDARVDANIAGKSTDDLAEGTNLYYTDARARAAISAGKGLSYDSGTGVVSANNSVYVASTEPMDWVVGDVWIETL